MRYEEKTDWKGFWKAYSKFILFMSLGSLLYVEILRFIGVI